MGEVFSDVICDVCDDGQVLLYGLGILEEIIPGMDRGMWVKD